MMKKIFFCAAMLLLLSKYGMARMAKFGTPTVYRK